MKVLVALVGLAMLALGAWSACFSTPILLSEEHGGNIWGGGGGCAPRCLDHAICNSTGTCVDIPDEATCTGAWQKAGNNFLYPLCAGAECRTCSVTNGKEGDLVCFVGGPCIWVLGGCGLWNGKAENYYLGTCTWQ